MSDALAVVPVDGPLDVTTTVPGSKSITNRALLCAALASGVSRIEKPLLADDTEAMIDCLCGLGIEIAHSAEGDKGILIMIVDSAAGDLFRGGLLARGFRPAVHRLQ